MTKSTITRERIQRIIRAIDSESYDEEEIREWLTSDEIMELSRMALTVMDSEPYGFTDGDRRGMIYKPEHADRLSEPVPVYRHAQPVVPDGLVKAVEFYEQVKRENPPVETGAWKDAVDWVLKEACRAAMLAAAPQPQNAPQNIPEIIPDCWCRTCRPVVLNDMRFVVCPDCGNKRCPRANDHRNACTGSNESGQEGSAYPDTPREVKP